MPSRVVWPQGRHCRLIDSASAPTQLPDGQPVAVAEGAPFVEQGGRYLLLGDRTVIDTGARLRLARVNEAEAMGVLLDGHGLATLVPSPPGTRQFASPKILRATATGTEVLWIDPDSVNARGPQPARIMAARYDRRSWSTTTTIAHVARLLISPKQTATPITIPGGVALAITKFSPDSGTFIELLVEQNGIWSQRLAVPGYQALYPSLATRGIAWFLVFIGRDSANTVGLFIVRSLDAGVTWSSPYLIAAGRAYEPQLLAFGQGLALVWVGEHQSFGPLGMHVAFSGDGTHWTPASAFDSESDSTTAAMAIAFDDWHIALVRLIGQSGIDHLESFEMVSRTARDVLWTKRLTGVEPPLLIKDGTDTITLLTSGGSGTPRSFVPSMTLSRVHVHCE